LDKKEMKKNSKCSLKETMEERVCFHNALAGYDMAVCCMQFDCGEFFFLS
jgi:hypothetical protein